MSIAATLAAARRELAVVHTATCEIRTAATQWAANPSARSVCHYELTTPARGEHLDLEAGNGYGYTVRFLGSPTIDVDDAVVIVASPNAADVGLELQVQRVPPRSNNSIALQIDTVKR